MNFCGLQSTSADTRFLFLLVVYAEKIENLKKSFLMYLSPVEQFYFLLSTEINIHITGKVHVLYNVWMIVLHVMGLHIHVLN